MVTKVYLNIMAEFILRILIKVKVSAPKRIAGEREFANLGEFYTWMNENLKRPKNLKGDALLAVAEVGHYSSHTQGHGLNCTNDQPSGYKAKELARKTGFLTTSPGGDTAVQLEKAALFLEALDN